MSLILTKTIYWRSFNDYINGYRRIVIDSLISFQIENFIESKKVQKELYEVVDMQMSVEELFIQTEREYEFDSGFNKGVKEGKKEGKKEGRDEIKEEIILNMLKDSVDDESIQKFTDCSAEDLNKIKRKYLDAIGI